MMFAKLFRFARLIQNHKHATIYNARKGRRNRLPQLEILEDRTVPTGLVVTDLTSGLTALNLASNIMGPGIAVTNVQLTAAPGTPANDVKFGNSSSAGAFSGGLGILGFDSGIILSTGGVQNVVGPNVSDSISQTNNTAGDPPLSTLIGGATNDATILQFDFVPQKNTLSFNYVFASDEYNEFSNTQYNDVFGAFLSDVTTSQTPFNIAVLPASTTPVSVNTVNGTTNAQFFIDNDITAGAPINTEMNGLTKVLSASSAVVPGHTYHVRLTIADATDGMMDSNVFIQASSFTTYPAPMVTTSQATVTYGTPVTFTATETTAGTLATDTVSFYDGTTFLGTGILASNNGNTATWTYTTTATQLQAGNAQSIEAIYTPTGSTPGVMGNLVGGETVLPHALTITATTNTKAYDSTTSAAAFPAVVGLQGSDTVTGLSETYNNPSAGTGKTLSVSNGYTVNDGNSGNNYVLSVNSTTGTITKAALTITAATNTKTYDATTTAAATPSVAGLVGADTVLNLAEVYANRNAGTGKTLSVSAYTVNDGNAGNNYAVTTVANTTGVINKAALTVTATTNTKTYDSTTSSTATPTVAGLQGSDTVTGLAEVFSSRNASSPGKTLLSVSAYTVNDGNGGNNYAVTTVTNLTGMINKAALTITALTNTKLYDGSTSAAAIPTVAGLIGNDTVTGLAEAYSDKNAGASKTLSVSAYTVNDGFRGFNYAVTTVNNTTGVINKATLTITATTNTKTYDSTTTAAALPTVAGLQGTDTVTGLAEVYANKNAGTGKTLSVSTYTVNDGNGGNNYTVTTVTDTTGVINKASLTITATTNTKTYDSTTTAAALPTVSGLIGADSATGLAEVYSDRNAGSSKTLSVSAYTINDGNGGNNYAVTTVTNTTGLINRASLTITATTNTKTYDSTTTAAALPTVTGIIGNDSVTGLAEVYTSASAGTGKTLSVSAYTVNDGNSGNNYTVTTVANTTGVINKASLTITATTNTKTYDSTTTAAALPTVAGLIGTDTVTGLAEVYTDKNAGTGKTLSVSAYTVNDGNSGNNYTVTTLVNTTGVINKASLTITATTNTKTYDSTTTAAATPTVSGLIGADTATGLTEVYSDRNAGSSKTLSVSAYTINDGNGGNNYAVSTVTNTTGLINKASLTITATTNTKTYDSTTSAAATPTVSGLIGADTATGLTEVYSDRNAGSSKTLSVTGYTINDGNAGNNYTVTTVTNTTGVINKASLTISATTNTKVYDSTTTAAAVPTVAGLVGNDTVTNLAEIYTDANAGTGKTLSVSSYAVNDGNGGNNYTVTTMNDTTGAITKATLTITATTNTKNYDSTTSAAATPTVSGLIGTDSVTGLAEVYADKNAGSSKTLSVSSYTVNDGNSGNNYTVTTVTDMTGVINRASLTITATTNTKVYDATTSAAAVPTVTGLVGADTATGLTEVYTDANAGSGKTLSVSAYSINDGNGGNNYTVTTVANTTGLISKAALAISAITNAKTYDSTTSSAAIPLVTGLQGSDTVTGLSESFNSRTVGNGKTLTVNTGYTINDGNGGNNYTVTTANDTTGAITQASLTITASTNTKTYDSKVTAAAIPTVSGLFGNDSVTGLAEVYADANAGSSKTLSVTTYTVNDGNGGNNYIVTTVVDTTGVINQAALTISAKTNTKSYDASTSASAIPTVTSGLVGGDTVTGLAEVYADPNAGTGKTLSVSAYTINDGNGGNNYTVTTVTSTTGVINKAALTIQALTFTKSYDASTSAAVIPQVTGLKGGDSVTGLSESYNNKNVGNAKLLSVNPGYTINDGNGGNNYTVTTFTNGSGSITKATLTITASTNTKTYDSTTTAAAIPTVSGLFGGDTVTGLSEAYLDKNAGIAKTLKVNAGYTVVDGNGGNNYTVATANDTTGVITPAPLTITAQTNTKNFDGVTSAAAKPTVSGLIGNDKATGLAEMYADPNPGTGKTLSVTGYTINDGNGGNNYTVTTVNDTTGVIIPTFTFVSIFNTTGSELEPPQGGSANYVFTVTLAQALIFPVTFNYSTFNGTGPNAARAGTDFNGITNAILTIPAGQTSAQINITILGDAPNPNSGSTDEYFTVTLNWAVSSINVNQPILTASAQGDIKQTFVPTVSMPVSQPVHISGTTYAVQLNLTSTYPSAAYAQAAGDVFVNYYTTNGTATAGTNYQGVSGTLDIPYSQFVAPSNTATILITGIGAASGQTLNLNLSGISSNAALVGSSGVVSIFNPQLAAGSPTTPGGIIVVSAGQFAPVINAAEANWVAAGVPASTFKDVVFQIRRIGPNVLANTTGKLITIDPSAAGFGWFNNPSNGAFQPIVNSTNLSALPDTLAAGHMDLLTVVEHELGHVIGLPDMDAGDSLMTTMLKAGERRVVPTALMNVTAPPPAGQAGAAPPQILLNAAYVPAYNPLLGGTGGNNNQVVISTAALDQLFAVLGGNSAADANPTALDEFLSNLGFNKK